MDKNSKLGFIYLSHDKTVSDVPGGVQSSDIVFYEDKHQIIVNGQVFGVTNDQATAISKIAGIESRVEMTTELSTTILAILRDTRSKLDGATLGKSGWQGVQSIQAIQDTQTDNAVDAINALNTYINGIQTRLNNTVAGVASVNGQTGAVKLDGANLSTTDGAGEMFKNKKLDTAFKGVQSNIDGIQARIAGEIKAREDGIQGVQGQINSAVTGLQSQLATSISGVQSQLGGIDFGHQTVKSYVDAANTQTLSDAKAYVDQLGGTNWTKAAETVQDIITELSEEGKGTFVTVVDKIRGNFGYVGNQGNQNIKDYIDYKTGSGAQGAQTLAGTAETNAKYYTNTEIQKLNATETGTSEGNYVKVTVVEAAGKITNVNVVATDIASATELESVKTELAGAQGRITAVETKISGVENQLTWRVVK